MKILGIGNALVDILIKLDNEDLLNELNMPKGSMNLIDLQTRDEVLKKLQSEKFEMTTGGSAGNTCKALAYMNVPVGFIGKLGDNHYGQFYEKEFKQSGVESHFIHTPNNHTGTAVTFITPDGERTFGTYLGAAVELNKNELKKEVFSEYSYFYAEGYLVQNHELIENAFAMAKFLGLKTAIDLASYNIVHAEREFLSSLIDKYVDIVFANKEEAQALTGKSPEEAVKKIGEKAEISVVKSGSDGSYVAKEGEIIHVPVQTKLQPIDTTAAGDYYAAGFLYGMQNGKTMEQCSKLGALLAGEIIRVVGTNLDETCWNNIKIRAQKI
ncbi:MAG: adenosine kinase [Dysgonamonadaceae bacterium]|jgi:sugar/nucleoside kinase (ribokinase family)|nr:adenosine kinase [Dysgonamonadaceae bacterium]